MPGSQLNFISNKHGFGMHFTDDGGNCLIPVIKKRAFIASLELLERYFSIVGC